MSVPSCLGLPGRGCFSFPPSSLAPGDLLPDCLPNFRGQEKFAKPLKHLGEHGVGYGESQFVRFEKLAARRIPAPQNSPLLTPSQILQWPRNETGTCCAPRKGNDFRVLVTNAAN